MSNDAKTQSRAQLLKRQQELQAEQKAIEDALEANRMSELHGLVDAFKGHLKSNDFTLDEALKLLGVKKGRAARGTGTKKVPESLDKDGKKPEAGSTYKHSSWSAPWTATGKRSPKHVIATIKSGKTWASLLQK